MKNLLHYIFITFITLHVTYSVQINTIYLRAFLFILIRERKKLQSATRKTPKTAFEDNNKLVIKLVHKDHKLSSPSWIGNFEFSTFDK